MTDPRKSVGPYKIDEALETSRDAALYRASDPVTGALVLVDAIHHPPAGWSVLQLREDLRPLRHDSLAEIIDAVVDGTSHYVVYTYVAGQRLVELLRGGAMLAPEVVVGHAEVLCDVIGYLHQQTPRRLHGDLKPANLWLADGGTLRVLDVGMPRRITTAYHAPEGSIDPRSDVYNLAATLYHMLTGRPPPMAGERAGGEPLDQGLIPQPWRAGISAGLALRPDGRPATIDEFRSMLPIVPATVRMAPRDDATVNISPSATRRLARSSVVPLVVLLAVIGLALAFAVSRAREPARDHGWIDVPAGAGVAAFRIARTEVTNAQYAACLAARGCTRPYDTTRLDDPAFADWPVVYVTIRQAREYAAWAGGRLPAEAEWQQACASDGQPQPWGNALPDARRAMLDAADAGPVGRRPDGATREGALDVVGNVWEWVDAADSDVVRGGGFDTPGITAGCASRQQHQITVRQQNIGFRIAAGGGRRLGWWGAVAALGVALVLNLVAIVRRLRAAARGVTVSQH